MVVNGIDLIKPSNFTATWLEDPSLVCYSSSHMTFVLVALAVGGASPPPSINLPLLLPLPAPLYTPPNPTSPAPPRSAPHNTHSPPPPSSRYHAPVRALSPLSPPTTHPASPQVGATFLVLAYRMLRARGKLVGIRGGWFGVLVFFTSRDAVSQPSRGAAAFERTHPLKYVHQCGGVGAWDAGRVCTMCEPVCLCLSLMHPCMVRMCALYCECPILSPLPIPRLMCANHALNAMVIKIVIAGVSVIFYKATQAVAVVTGAAGIYYIIIAHRCEAVRRGWWGAPREGPGSGGGLGGLPGLGV